MQARPFYLSKRRSRSQKNNKPIFYVRFRGADGRIATAMTTGQTSRGAAEAWALNYLRGRGALTGGLADRRITFGQYSRDWWVWGSCPYIASKQARGFTISRAYADRRHFWLHRYVLPQFKDRRLAEFTPALIEGWIMGMFREGRLSPASINRILGTLKVMLGEAVRLGHLQLNPASAVGELKEIPRERGILSIGEMRALFDPLDFSRVWSSDLRHFGANLLAASTGMRLGEVQGLQRLYVFADHVAVVHSYDDRYGLAPPKWNSAREIPVPSRVAKTLHALMELSSHREQEHFVFWGRDGEHPLSKTALLAGFKRALAKIGITEQKRRQRDLVFHSWRHGINTLLRGKISDENLRRVRGHKTLALTDAYDHPGAEHLADVRREQEVLFG